VPEPKVVIEKYVLPGLHDDRLLQRVATVLVGTEEYFVYAPARANGNPLDWLDNSRVHTPTDRGENAVNARDSRIILDMVRRKLQESSRPPGTTPTPNVDDFYFHVRFYLQRRTSAVVRFDLSRSELEQRILGPYREKQPIVIGGETIQIQHLERIQVYKSLRPSAQFGAFVVQLAKQLTDDWHFGQDDIKDVTDELIRTPSIDVLPQKTDAIELLCFRFHEVVKQLRKRYDSRSTIDVADEYDVQDLLHAVLRIFFDDVRPEEWTPSYAGKSARMDFLLPELETVVEVKKTREGLGTKEIGDELIVDIARYRTHPSCKRLICFVYDPESRISNPRGIESDLSQKHADLDVKVIIEPES
jgi:REase_DpnII-MboI